MLLKHLFAIALLVLPGLLAPSCRGGRHHRAREVREGDAVQIGNSRLRLGGIDAPSVDQLCLNHSGERWTCGVAARDELIKHADNRPWTCHVRQATPTAAAGS